MLADVSLINSASGATVSVLPVPVGGPAVKFAREVVRSVFPAIVLHRARILSAIDPESTPALLWRASALQLSSRVGPTKPEEFALYEKVLARDPKQLTALLGLGRRPDLKVARDQSPHRMADIRRAESLMQTAYEEAPDFPERSPSSRGCSKSCSNNMTRPSPISSGPSGWTDPMDRSRPGRPLQDVRRPVRGGLRRNGGGDAQPAARHRRGQSAFIAGETALVAGHPDRAVEYLDIAVSGNPMIARIQALRAAALWMAGRHAEARAAAGLSQTLTPPHSPETMAKRGGPEASQRYKDARDRYLAAFRNALASPRPIKSPRKFRALPKLTRLDGGLTALVRLEGRDARRGKKSTGEAMRPLKSFLFAGIPAAGLAK